MGNTECRLAFAALDSAFNHPSWSSCNDYQRMGLVVRLYSESLRSNCSSPSSQSAAAPVPVLAPAPPLAATAQRSSSSGRHDSGRPDPISSRARCTYCMRLGHEVELCRTRAYAAGLCFVCQSPSHLSFSCNHLINLRNQLALNSGIPVLPVAVPHAPPRPHSDSESEF